jgi:uncharacterized membrane protein
MIYLIFGLLIFIATHSLRIFADGWRTQMVARLGEMPWKGVVSILSLAGLVLIVMGYSAARAQPVTLWQLPFWVSHIVSLLMLVAMILLVAAYVPRNAIKSRIGHPMIVSVKIWAFSHLLANGTLADLILFGALLGWAVLSFRAARKRDSRDGVVQPAGTMLGTLATIGIGSAVWAWFVFQGHAWLIGVQPILMRG